MPENIVHPRGFGTKKPIPNPVSRLSANVADSVTNIASPASTETFTVKGRSFSAEEYVKNALLPLAENVPLLMNAFQAIPNASR
jgi:hypothetical protein